MFAVRPFRNLMTVCMKNSNNVRRNVTRKFGDHVKAVRPEGGRPKDFEGFMRWYLVQDYQVVFFIIGAWISIGFLGKGISSCMSSGKPKVTAPPAVQNEASTDDSANKGAMPSDIDSFLVWMEEDAGNLDKALASL